MSEQFTELEKIEAIEKESRAFECPNCHTHLQFMVRVGVMGVRPAEVSAEQFLTQRPNDTPPKDPLTPTERGIVNEAKESGTFQAFEVAVRARPNAVPTNLEKFFITFLKSATRMKTPQFAIRMCLPNEDTDGKLELWQGQSVAAVVRNGEFKCFLPKHLIDGKKADFLAISDGKLRTEQSDMTLTHWVKTRNGYVAGRGLMFDELKGRAAGDFAKATGNY